MPTTNHSQSNNNTHSPGHHHRRRKHGSSSEGRDGLGGSRKKKRPKTLAAIRAARAVRIYDQLRAKAPPGTFIVLANNRPAEMAGQSSNFLDVYHVARPRVIYHGSPADTASKKLSLHDMNKAKVKKGFAKAAKWMRYMTIFAGDGQVQASIDLGDTSTIVMAQPPPFSSSSSSNNPYQNQQQQQHLMEGEEHNNNNSVGGGNSTGIGSYIGWLKNHWKLCAVVVVVLLLVCGGTYWWYFKR